MNDSYYDLFCDLFLDVTSFYFYLLIPIPIIQNKRYVNYFKFEQTGSFVLASLFENRYYLK